MTLRWYNFEGAMATATRIPRLSSAWPEERPGHTATSTPGHNSTTSILGTFNNRTRKRRAAPYSCLSTLIILENVDHRKDGKGLLVLLLLRGHSATASDGLDWTDGPQPSMNERTKRSNNESKQIGLIDYDARFLCSSFGKSFGPLGLRSASL